MRETRGLPPLPSSKTRPVTSLGARGLLSAGFGISPEHPGYGPLREEFLRLYETHICRETRLFPEIAELLDTVEARGMRWGIVTNKAEHLARRLLSELRLTSRTACIIGGDTTPHLKPHPASLLEACKVMREDASACVYVGDDQRDIDAGRAAGMKTAVASWGYLNGGDPESWKAEWLLAKPRDLLACLQASRAAISPSRKTGAR